MSLWSRRELDIVLYPQRIVLRQSERKLTLRGYQAVVHADEILTCEVAAEDEMPWHSALRMLKMELPALIKYKTEAKVTISNHFMRYLIIPWLDKVSDEEEMVFTQHCFREVYGAAADSWSVRISPDRTGVATLASAVDSRLLDELRESLGRLGLDIKSIQPHLMAAFNSCRPSLQGRSAWVAFLEPGNLCLAVLKLGQLVWIKKLRISDAWCEELATILQREMYLADAESGMDEVLLWAPHLKDKDIPSGGHWKFQHMRPEPVSGRSMEYGSQQTLAVVH